MKYLQMLRNRRKKKLRALNVTNETTWVRIGEIYSCFLINREVSLSNEDIVEMAIQKMHKEIVVEGRLER